MGKMISCYLCQDRIPEKDAVEFSKIVVGRPEIVKICKSCQKQEIGKLFSKSWSK